MCDFSPAENDFAFFTRQLRKSLTLPERIHLRTSAGHSAGGRLAACNLPEKSKPANNLGDTQK